MMRTKMVTGILARTLDGSVVHMPDREITDDLPTCELVPLQMFDDRVAVIVGEECIGWIRTDRGT